MVSESCSHETGRPTAIHSAPSVSDLESTVLPSVRQRIASYL
jgi:hypothetical protein